jgi:hypothetical protein
MLDIFNSNAFGIVHLTDAVNRTPFVPGRIGQMGLFGAGTGITTTSVLIEEKDGFLKMLSPTPRGAPGETLDKKKRRLRSLAVPHFEVNDAVMAEEVQGVRAFGSETELETVMGKIAERNRDVIAPSFAITEEYARVGAVKGIITYADGSTMSLFTEFGVTQPDEVPFVLDAANPVDGALRNLCASIYRQVSDKLGGVPFSHIHAFVGNDFFDYLIKHKEVRATYLNQEAAGELRMGSVNANGLVYGSFMFGGIVWENYRGSYNGSPFFGATNAQFVPVGVPNLFRTVYAPADYIETVNTVGKRLYAKQYPMENGKGVYYDAQMNSLSYCTRPEVLIPGRLGS